MSIRCTADSPREPAAGRSRCALDEAPGGSGARVLALAMATALLAGCGPSDAPAPEATRPADTPALHHVGLNSTAPSEAVSWYLALWPDAEATRVAGRLAVAGEMYLVFDSVGSAPPGAFDPSLGRSVPQSALWHIGAFANTTDDDDRLGAIGVDHLPLHLGPAHDGTVWRSGLTPYAGIVAADAAETAGPAGARDGGFSYVLGPDGALFELTGGPRTSPSLSHVHFFHEQPQCAANWYVDHLGMSLPPVRNDDGSTEPRPAYEPCEADLGAPGWPSLEEAGTIRQPRGTVVHGNGSMSWYPRQCVRDRCGDDQPLVPSRGQVLDHVAFSVRDLDAWRGWLEARGINVPEEVHDFGDGRAFLLEGPDGLAIELVESNE